ncbi:MAG TPA: tRNA guanosine(34) transglycosylase Tgt [Candidatus Paceibacterota bacterium]|nr:tRNA guanosine(34) transglycosylase Tgt [Candidatus Paceibacterota bacterium]
MIGFRILKKSKRSRARLGVLTTPHGEVETPTLVPVGTLAAVKAMRSDEVAATRTQMIIANTYHLHLMPGEKVVKAAGGLQKFMNWPRPMMTDSGGFQVFSLGFGRDLGVGKVAKHFVNKIEQAVERGDQPKSLRITDDGVRFISPLTGDELFLGPKESVRIQEALGADIMFAFDECTPPRVSREYMKKSLARTHAWAKRCLEARRTSQALYGIVQGSLYENLRKESARFVNGLPFDGFGIGGDLGDAQGGRGSSGKGDQGVGTKKILEWTLPLLDERKPRHLLGIGYLEDIETIVKQGIDTFDCTVPTHYARRGIAFTSAGRLDLGKAAFLNDRKPLDPKCGCLTCAEYTRSYVAHLVRAKEITAATLITFHNLHYFNSYVEGVRNKIRKGLL